MIPRVSIFKWSTCDPLRDDEEPTEGRTLVLSWLGIVVEFSIGRHVI